MVLARALRPLRASLRSIYETGWLTILGPAMVERERRNQYLSSNTPTAATPAPANASMPFIGDILGGKYRLVRELGAGGMGIVYEAEHLRLRQPFALKILQPEFAREREFLIRFEREARAAALLRSPNIVRVFDVDVAPEGFTYMVMELLEGRDLAAEIDEGGPGRISPPQLVDWIIQVCSALQEAHDNGIVHRDLKPANIFLAHTETKDVRIAKVLDFGISKIDAASTGAVTNRAAGALGTPTYMAPEQIRNRRVDGRSDVWALGVILYRVLAGRWPFSGRDDQGYMAAVLADPPLPFEMARPDLPYELASVIMKALEKSPSDRFATATDLARALLPFGTGRTSLNVVVPPARSSSRSNLAAIDVAATTASPAAGSSSAGASTRPAKAADVLDGESTERSPNGGVAPAPPAPLAIVIPADVSARADRQGVMATVANSSIPPAAAAAPLPSDAPPTLAMSTLAMRTPGSPPATAFTPPSTIATTGSSKRLVFTLAAAGFAAALGFGTYMAITTTRTAPPTTPSVASPPPSSLAATPSAPSSSSSSLSPASSTPSQTAPAAVASSSPPVVTTPKKRPPRPPTPTSSSAAPTPTTSSQPDLPDHL